MSRENPVTGFANEMSPASAIPGPDTAAAEATAAVEPQPTHLLTMSRGAPEAVPASAMRVLRAMGVEAVMMPGQGVGLTFRREIPNFLRLDPFRLTDLAPAELPSDPAAEVELAETDGTDTADADAMAEDSASEEMPPEATDETVEDLAEDSFDLGAGNVEDALGNSPATDLAGADVPESDPDLPDTDFPALDEAGAEETGLDVPAEPGDAEPLGADAMAGDVDEGLSDEAPMDLTGSGRPADDETAAEMDEGVALGAVETVAESMKFGADEFHLDAAEDDSLDTVGEDMLLEDEGMPAEASEDLVSDEMGPEDTGSVDTGLEGVGLEDMGLEDMAEDPSDAAFDVPGETAEDDAPELAQESAAIDALTDSAPDDIGAGLDTDSAETAELDPGTGTEGPTGGDTGLDQIMDRLDLIEFMLCGQRDGEAGSAESDPGESLGTRISQIEAGLARVEAEQGRLAEGLQRVEAAVSRIEAALEGLAGQAAASAAPPADGASLGDALDAVDQRIEAIADRLTEVQSSHSGEIAALIERIERLAETQPEGSVSADDIAARAIEIDALSSLVTALSEQLMAGQGGGERKDGLEEVLERLNATQESIAAMVSQLVEGTPAPERQISA
ncbi:hypothetical protein EV657_10359 [Rhodovulum visakhapatnamense]|uniref:Uncharacterized protein n=1 Tax=Rhodovulum visakhapatnamense TaxID=364297 RepID=A0A4V3GUW9_9RHOB|nr:hypothetical protein EV657_10359 [Rhodovulum visakhapatnamense]